MVRSWADFRAYVTADRISRRGGNLVRAFLWDPRARFAILMRFNEWLLNAGWPWIVRAPGIVWYRRLSVRLGFSIPLNIFGPGVAFPHYGLIVIAPTVRIGRNCRMHVGVHLGGAAVMMDPRDIVGQSAPLLGDNVYIAPGAKLYGPTVIGDDCVIGTNAVVTKSFPQTGVTLAGMPAKVISEKGSDGMLVRGADQVPYLNREPKP